METKSETQQQQQKGTFCFIIMNLVDVNSSKEIIKAIQSVMKDKKSNK